MGGRAVFTFLYRMCEGPALVTPLGLATRSICNLIIPAALSTPGKHAKRQSLVQITLYLQHTQYKITNSIK